MIGIYGLSKEQFNSLHYSWSKEYSWIDYGAGNCHGKSFDAILSYKANIPKEILHNLRGRVCTLMVHFVKEIKEEE